MTFAPAEYEIIQELSGFKLSLFLAVRHEEFLDGACKLSPTELSKKYKQISNESNTARVRKQMIKEGWFIEAVGGIVTKKFNETAKIAVTKGDEAAKIAVWFWYLLQKLQSSTAKIAGTEIANKDLELEDNLKQDSLSPRTRANQRGLTADEAANYLENPPDVPDENLSPTRAIEIYREIYPNSSLDGQTLKDFAATLPEVEETVWRQTLFNWRLARYKASNIPGMISKYQQDLKETQNGANGNGSNSMGNGRNHREQSAINRIQTTEQIRARVNARKNGGVRGSGLPDS